ncbi:MAG TPA: hypothetical protein VJW20_07100 [Candidatus Angelobacter sp.]|nr:hypothetical protein [Candidatus Angelobacter sp.]
MAPVSAITRTNILALLKGGDRRSIGRSGQIAGAVAADPKLFSALIKGLWSNNAVVRMRSADAVEKVTRQSPQLLQPYRKELLGLIAETEQQEVRWHLATMAPKIASTPKERLSVAASLLEYLDDRSSIVRTFALQGLAELARDEPELRTKVIEILRQANRSGTAAMKARSRKLLRELESE